MGGVVEGVKTVNSFIRTLLGVAVVGLLGAGGWLGYTTWHAGDIALQKKQAALDRAEADLATARADLQASAAQIGQLEEDVARQSERIEKLETSLRLVKVDHRLARLRVLDQSNDAESGKLFTTLEFVEENDEGAPIDAPRRFRIEGDLVYVDSWIVKFDDKYVEQADLDRSTSICLFRRIFGQFQEPHEGHVIDQVGARPTAYARGGAMSPFEQKIWDDFWEIANNPRRAGELGIRAAHGEAPSIKLRPGKSYRLLLRAAGGLTITPEAEPPEPPAEAAASMEATEKSMVPDRFRDRIAGLSIEYCAANEKPIQARSASE